jgi:hypothetical protein
MKTKVLILLFAPLMIGAVASCKKKGCTDETATNFSEKAKKDDGTCLYTPVISIIGASDTTISVSSVYTDPGATAANFDGALVGVQSTSTVNTNLVGVYEVNYSATNNNGTSTAKRTVRVVVNQDSYLGPWTTSGNCDGQAGMALNNDPTITAGGTSDEILITDFFNGLTSTYGTAICYLNGDEITVPQAQDGAPGGLGDIIYSGFGSMNEDGQTFTITFTYQNTTPLTGTSGTCTSTFTK